MSMLQALAFAMSVVMATPALAFQAGAGTGYYIKPSDVRLPPGAELGLYRRTIQPFPNWDLICDEDLRSMSKVCNITQTIQENGGNLAFGWSLTATESGQPLFLLRAPASVGPGNTVTVELETGKETAVMNACDLNVCTGLLPIGDALAREIANGSEAKISYRGNRGVVTLAAPLIGLSAAVAAID